MNFASVRALSNISICCGRIMTLRQQNPQELGLNSGKLFGKNAISSQRELKIKYIGILSSLHIGVDIFWFKLRLRRQFSIGVVQFGMAIQFVHRTPTQFGLNHE